MNDQMIVEAFESLAAEAKPEGGQWPTLERRIKRQRRRIVASRAMASALVVAAAVVGVPRIASVLHTQTPQSPSLIALASGNSQLGATDQQILQDALGTDFAISNSGDATVAPGSPSAEGLPSHVTIFTQLLSGISTPKLDVACAPVVEKESEFDACQRQESDGNILYTQTIQGQPGTQAVADQALRVIYPRQADLVIVDLVVREDGSLSTPETRAAVTRWLSGMLPRMITAATDPRVSSIAARPYTEKGSVIPGVKGCIPSGPADRKQPKESCGPGTPNP